MIVPTQSGDFDSILSIINEASVAYKNIIPKDRWKEPYMPKEELLEQLTEGVVFWKYVQGDMILGVMGLQEKSDVTLIRHAYVRTIYQQKGVGGKLLSHLLALTKKPTLIGTWSDAIWAIDFYKKHGFKVVNEETKNKLLNKYWNIPERQVETSVVLADPKWRDKTG